MSLNNSTPKNLDLSAIKVLSSNREPSITSTNFLFVDFIFDEIFFLDYICVHFLNIVE